MTQKAQQIHFIAIGGSIMHNLALALHDKGYIVTGSDDHVYEPSKSRLSKAGILPQSFGWDTSKVNKDLDCVILGMHAKVDNPELLKAQELGVKIYSFPEYIYQQSIDKQRIVIAGSHGKTSTTSMIMHVLKANDIDFDYAVGASIEGFDRMVKLSDAPFIIIEGDEYLSSPLDLRPKFLNYQPHIALINGIAWDHINVFKTFKDYLKQFELLSNIVPKGGALIYNVSDKYVKKIAEANKREDILKIDYKVHSHKIKKGITYLKTGNGDVEIKIFGEHNLINLNAARLICERVGIREDKFYNSIQNFTGAGKRLEIISKNSDRVIFKDFAHAPSKVSATIEATKEQYGKQQLTAILELHTFSSLSKEFLPQYAKSMNKADEAYIYLSKETLKRKGGNDISDSEIQKAFANKKITVIRDVNGLGGVIKQIPSQNNILLMSSGDFDGLDMSSI